MKYYLFYVASIKIKLNNMYLSKNIDNGKTKHRNFRISQKFY